MLRRRRIILAVVLVGVAGSLLATVAYAAFVRSDAYRSAIEAQLSEMLGLTTQLTAVRPLSFNSREFIGVRVRVPESRLAGLAPGASSDVFACDRAVWRDLSVEGHRRFALDLSNGRVLLGTARWLQSDYRRMLRSGLGHDFARLGLAEIHLDGMNLEWMHPDFRLIVDDAHGEVLFDEDGTGRASIHSRTLNHTLLNSPMHISAVFTPGARLRFHEVTLTVPELSLSVLRLDRLLKSSVTQGTFEGQMTYRERASDQIIEAKGRLENASLHELTSLLRGGPYGGSVTASLDLARLVNGRLDQLRFQGTLSDIRVGELIPLIGTSEGDEGRANLRVHQVEYENGVIRYLSISGQVQDISTEALTQLLGYGTITGRLRVKIHSLVVIDDRIQSADLEIHAVAPPDQPGTIDRDTLAAVGQEMFGFDIQKVLPKQIEYVEMGARLILDDGRLRIRGTHGPDGRTIVTLRLFGRDWPVLREPDRSFVVPDLLALLRRRLEPIGADDISRWWKEYVHENESD